MRSLRNMLRMKILGRCLAIFHMAFATTSTGAAEYPFTIEYLKLDAGVLVVANNEGNRRVSAILTIKRSENLGSQREWPATIEIAPATKSPVGLLFPANPSRPWRFKIEGTYTFLEQPTGASPTPAQDFRATDRAELQRHLAPVRHLAALFNTNQILGRSEYIPTIIAIILVVAIAGAFLSNSQRRKSPTESEVVAKEKAMNRYQLPESVKERNLQRVRSRLGGAAPCSSRPKSSGNPGIAMLGISAFLMAMYLGIGALITGKSAIQIFTGVSLLLGQSPLLSAVMCWLSVIGSGAVLHGIFTATNSKQD